MTVVEHIASTILGVAIGAIVYSAIFGFDPDLIPFWSGLIVGLLSSRLHSGENAE